MSEEFKNISSGNYAGTADALNPVIIRRKIKKGYHWAGAVILIFTALTIVCAFFYSIIYAAAMIPKVAAESPGMELTAASEMISESLVSGDNMIYYNSAVTLLSDIVAFIILLLASNMMKMKDIMKKSKLPLSFIAMCAVGLMGVQCFSLTVQQLITSITGYTGINEQVSAALSFGDTPLATAVMLIYTVILGPIMEELLFRGFAMNALGAVDRKFGVIASALLFGLMHSNFNQIFNGFLLGLVLGYAAYKCGSVIPSIILHIFGNAHAMLISYFSEVLVEKLGDEKANAVFWAYMIVVFAAGAVFIVLTVRKYGLPSNEDVIVPGCCFEIGPEDTKKLTWPAFLSSPTVIISAVICIVPAIGFITAV